MSEEYVYIGLVIVLIAVGAWFNWSRRQAQQQAQKQKTDEANKKYVKKVSQTRGKEPSDPPKKADDPPKKADDPPKKKEDDEEEDEKDSKDGKKKDPPKPAPPKPAPPAPPKPAPPAPPKPAPPAPPKPAPPAPPKPAPKPAPSLGQEWQAAKDSRAKHKPRTWKDDVKDMVKDQAIDAAASAAKLAAKKAKKAAGVVAKAVKKAAKTALKKFKKALAKSAAKQAGKALTKIGTSKLAKMGFKSGGAVVGRAAAKAAAKKLGKAGAKAAAKMAAAAAKSASKAAAKGGPTPVGAAMMVFDLASMTLDILDVGGYGRMKTNNDLLQNRDMVDTSFEQQMMSEGNQLPMFTSPLDKLDAQDSLRRYREDEADKRAAQARGVPWKERDRKDETSLQDKKTEEISEQWLENPKSWLFQEILKKTNRTVASFDDEDDMKEFVAENVDKVPDNVLQDKLKAELCHRLGGKTMLDKLKDGSTVHVCTYKTAHECHTSYKWPQTEDPTNFDVYGEWVQRMDNGKGACVMQSPAFREQCEKAKSKKTGKKMFEYNPFERSCRVTSHYCRAKGAEFIGGDCKVPAGQQVAENIFGTTVTRGLKQVFDMSQYKPCNQDETDMGYTCMKKCPPGWTDMGLMCLEKCPAGWSDDGLFCRDPIKPPKSKSLEWATKENCGK